MATLQDITDAARGKSWQDLTTNQKNAAKAMLSGGFNDAQRAWLTKQWLVITQPDVDAINATLPAGTRVSPVADAGGALYVNADLLTDSQDPGSTYFAARAVIRRLVWAEVTPVDAKG